MATRRQDIMERLEPGEAEDCERTLEGAFERIFVPPTKGRDEFDIVVCHGNIIRWVVTKVLEVDPLSWLQMSIANCSITTVQVRSDGSMKLIGFADSGHIPYGMTSYPGTIAPQD
jgi:serine/threonine-protein phosphatase PGAM5